MKLARFTYLLHRNNSLLRPQTNVNEFKNTKLTAETFNANHDERVLRMRYLDNVYMHHITLTSSSRSQSVVQQKSAHLKKDFYSSGELPPPFLHRRHT